MEGLGIKITKNDDGKMSLTFRSFLDEDIDIKVIEGRVTWYREESVFGIEEAQNIADHVIAFNAFPSSMS